MALISRDLQFPKTRNDLVELAADSKNGSCLR